MGRIIIEYDWSTNPLGPIDHWPQSLMVTLGNLLHCNFPQFLFWDKDLICFYNDAYRPSLGDPGKHPAIGQKGQDLWPEIWNDIQPLIEQVMTAGKTAWFEDRLLPIYRNNKLENVYWTFSYSPAYGDNGQIQGVLVTCMETTAVVANRELDAQIFIQRTRDLKLAHAQLIEANTYLQQIINLFKEPLQVLQPIYNDQGVIEDFRFKLTNQAYAKYANATPEQIHDKRVGEVFPGYFQTSSFHNVAKTFETGKPDTWEIHYDQDGLDLYNQMSATKLGHQVIVHFTDFTKVKSLQLQLEKNIEELKRSNESLAEFSNAASHDLREPIRKITVFLSRLKARLADHVQEQDAQLFSKIENATDRMGQLIDDLIQFAHLQNQPFQKQEVNLNDTIKSVLGDLELVIEQKQARVDYKDLPRVNGHPQQLQQLFQNLISNSLKYSKEDINPEIKISATRVDVDGIAYQVITVTDNGIGFDQKYEHRIFETFARLHDKNQYKGNGIGLSIVKKIVDNHIGKIKVESKKGTGATFHIHLPL